MKKRLAILLTTLVFGFTVAAVPAWADELDAMTAPEDDTAAYLEVKNQEELSNKPVVEAEEEELPSAVVEPAKQPAQTLSTQSTPTDTKLTVQATPTPAPTPYDKVNALAQSNKSALKDGTYVFETALKGNQALADKNTNKTGASAVGIAALNFGDAQMWVLTHDTDGFVILRNLATGKYLEVSGGQATKGAAIQTNVRSDSRAQKWVLVKDSNGYIFVSALSTSDWMVADIANSSLNNGGKVLLWQEKASSADRKNQRWTSRNMTEAYAQLDAKAKQNASAIANGTYFISSVANANNLLDVSGASRANGANVTVWKANFNNNQKWVISHDANGYVVIKSLASGKVLDIAAASSNPGTNVLQWSYDANKRNQKWIIIKKGDYYVIESALYPGLALDIHGASTKSGANVESYTSHGGAAQQWFILNANPNVAAVDDLSLDGTWYKIASNIDGGFLIDIANNSRVNGGNAGLWTANGGFNQLFRLQFVKTNGNKGYYQIVSAISGKVLDVANASPLPGANILQWGAKSTAQAGNQLFAVTKNSDGSYTFVNKATGLALSAASSTCKNGVNIRGYIPNNSSTQRFKLNAVPNLINEGIYVITPQYTGRAIDIAKGSYASGARAVLYDQNSQPNQKFYFQRVGNNTYTIQALVSGLYLRMSGSDVVQGAKDSAAQWVPEIVNGYYRFRNVADKTKALDIYGGSSANNAKVGVYAANASKAQQFRLSGTVPISNGTYFIQVASSRDYVVDVTGKSKDNGTNVELWNNINSGAHKWDITRNSDGTYYIVNSYSGKALGTASASVSNGANIAQYTKNNGANQRWRINWSPSLGTYQIVNVADPNLSLTVDGAINKGTNIKLATNTSAATQRWSFQKTVYKLTRGELLSVLSSIGGSGSIFTFGGLSYNLNSAAGKQLQAAVNAIRGSGYDLGFVMIDLITGEGIASSATAARYSASTLKGPYVAAVNKYAAGSVDANAKSKMYNTIMYSSNEDYAALFNRYGSGVWANELAYCNVSLDSGRKYNYLSPRDLAKLWVGNYYYFFEETNGNSAWARSLYTQGATGGNAVIHNALSGSYTTYAKPGWYPGGGYNVQNDAGIVMAGSRPYVVAFMSSACGQYGKLQNLVRALDAVHKDYAK